MEKKTVGMLVCMLMIATALPALGAGSEDKHLIDNLSTDQLISITQNNLDTLAQPPTVEWVKTHGGSEFDMFRGVHETPDGGFIVSGGTEQSNILYPWVLKLDSNGDEVWNWTINQIFYNDTWYDITDSYLPFIHRYNNDYIICTLLEVYDPVAGEEVWYGGLLKFDEMGNEEWFCFLFELNEWTVFPNSMIQIDDGFIICGDGYEFIDPQNGKAALVKTDLTGAVQWYKLYDYDEEWDRGFGVYATSNDGYLLSGTIHYETADQDVWVIKTDADGNKTWDKVFGGPYSDQSFSPHCFETDDGDYIIGAWVFNFLGAGSGDLWIIKTDADGNMELNETFGSKWNDASWCMNEAHDEGYVFLVTHDYSQIHDHDIWVIKTDDEGNAFWTAKIEDPGLKEVGQNIRKTSDGGYIIVGRTGFFMASAADALIVKLGPEQPVEMPEMTVRRPRAKRVYLFDLFGIPFPFTTEAIVLGDLTFKAQAEDPSGIGEVEFFINGLLVGETNETQGLIFKTYNYKWTGAETGTYNVKIRAYNNYGSTCKEVVTVKKIV